MTRLLSLLAPIGLGSGSIDSHVDDDLVDRLSHLYTAMMFVVFCLIVSSKQYVGDPIHCWVPGHFTSNYAEYTNKICWVSNTYYLPPNEEIPDETPRKQIGYYQWVPMFLLAQAILFYLPYIIWWGMNSKAGIDINTIIEAGKTMHTTENREKTLRFMLRQMDRYLGHFRTPSGGCCQNIKSYLATRCSLVCGKKYGNFMVTLYLVTKLIYLINAVCQLFIMDVFLSADFHVYGARVVQGMLSNEEWPEARIFPRTTMCDFKVRALGNTHRHTVQCVLSINFFNEKIYLILWFWLVFLSAITAISLVIWLARIIFRIDQLRFVKRHLRGMGKLKRTEDKKLLRKFVVEYLRQDGVLVLRLINSNVNSLVVGELVAEMWENFLISPTINSSGKLNYNGSDTAVDDV